MSLYEYKVWHEGLHKYRVVKGNDKDVVKQKAAAQLAQWDDMWDRKCEAEERKAERERKAVEKEQKVQLAAERTSEAEQSIQDLERILIASLECAHEIDWSELKDKRPFPKPRPTKPRLPAMPEKPQLSDKPSSNDKPQRGDTKYRPKLSFLDNLFPRLKERKFAGAKAAFEYDMERWKSRVESWNVRIRRYKEGVKQLEQIHRDALRQYDSELGDWKAERDQFRREQQLRNEAVEADREAYLSGDASAICDYCEMVLTNSDYPANFPQSFDLEFVPESKTLVVEYSLPDIDSMPKIKSVKYVQTRDAFSETPLSDSARNRLYDTVLYQIAVRTVHELYDADVPQHIESIGFNGWVESVDKATGQDIRACILSLHVKREEYAGLNLAAVDAKACFRQLKGIGSSKLHSLSPVAPILQISKEDSRFTSSREIVDGLDQSANLAAMDWEEFEHLIRELFEKEFATGGGEVKVTQASRDGGVDAVAFDPDPIRGGKIVIQAKRYTNVVSVAAVRDLYGTVVNEGATKGILVTTSVYGPDAYEFAKGKPLTLLTGNHLLHLLQKHGHRGRIDLQEAKKLFAEREKAR